MGFLGQNTRLHYRFLEKMVKSAYNNGYPGSTMKILAIATVTVFLSLVPSLPALAQTTDGGARYDSERTSDMRRKMIEQRMGFERQGQLSPKERREQAMEFRKKKDASKKFRTDPNRKRAVTAPGENGESQE
jgi:hypothetical protein